MITCEVTSDWAEIMEAIDQYDEINSALEYTNIADYRLLEDDTPMLLAILTDKIIEDNFLKPVTSPILFEKGSFPAPKGLYSEEIFGTTPEEKHKKYGYIDLGGKFIHPYVYEVLVSLQRSISRIVAGEGSWKIEDGKFVEIKEDDPNYDYDATGLDFFINHFDELVFEENNSFMRKERVKFIKALSKDEIFVSKWIVIPVFYRDYDRSGKSRKTPEINRIYNNIIAYSNRLKQETSSFFNNKTKAAIQMQLLKIRKYGQKLLESKHGHIHKSVLGKSVIYGSRAVISVPVNTHAETPDDVLVDIMHTGIPMSICAVTGFPFVLRWITEFFRQEFESKIQKPVRVKQKNGSYKIEYMNLKDPLLMYTEEYIKKKINQFINTYGARFETVKVQLENGTEAEMMFTGTGYTGNRNSPNANTISTRPLTWTDLIYMACADTLEDKHVYITRYPLSDYFGTFPTKVKALSTVNTMPVMVNGKIYPHYPVVDPSLPEAVVSTMFIDTVTMSNLFLKGIGGDYDGDQITVKMVYTEEANEEADALTRSPKYFMNLGGDIIRTIGNEAFLTLYNMTTR